MMFGIRKQNYNYDIKNHSDSWPAYKKFLDLYDWEDIQDSNIRSILKKRSEFDPIYHASLSDQVKHVWPGMNHVKENYSQSWQDWFVLTVLQGKTKGYWLELGASDPVYMNNTYLLESKFDWHGLSIDKRENLQPIWESERKTPLSLVDVLETNWSDLLKNSPDRIDYLQIDLCDEVSLDALEKLPHDRYRFSVITYEHDVFQADAKFREQSRKIFDTLGYLLLIRNVAVKNYASATWEPFEDWYIDPNAIDPLIYLPMLDTSENIKLPHEIFVKI